MSVLDAHWTLNPLHTHCAASTSRKPQIISRTLTAHRSTFPLRASNCACADNDNMRVYAVYGFYAVMMAVPLLGYLAWVCSSGKWAFIMTQVCISFASLVPASCCSCRVHHVIDLNDPPGRLLPVCSQSVPNLLPAYSQSAPSLLPVCSQSAPNLIPVCSRFAPDLLPIAHDDLCYEMLVLAADVLHAVLCVDLLRTHSRDWHHLGRHLCGSWGTSLC